MCNGPILMQKPCRGDTLHRWGLEFGVEQSTEKVDSIAPTHQRRAQNAIN